MQIESPVNQLANVLQIQGQQQANQINGMKMQQAQVAQDRQNKLYSLMGGFNADTTDDQRSSALKMQAFSIKLICLIRISTKRAKTKSEGQFKMAEALSKFGGVQKDLSTRVMANPTLENATAALKQAAQYHKMLGFGDMDVSGELSSLQARLVPTRSSNGQQATH